ncbi:tRNA pseudouridine synthase 1 [Phlyctochytrium planicorne]|nr:tRNA pseudouridine synthase 1 [Phlyctochytrium planicorne]
MDDLEDIKSVDGMNVETSHAPDKSITESAETADGTEIKEEDKSGQKRKREDGNDHPQKRQTRPPKEKKEGDEDESKVPKRRVAVLLGYCGSGYHGMQLNPNVASIELELHKAFAASGVVSPENAMEPSKVGFFRCARTDKGVHAAGQVVTLKMRMIDDPIQKINEHLPDQIRIFDIVKVTSNFNPKNQCDGRLYEYVLPTYIFDPNLNTELYNVENPVSVKDLPDTRRGFRINVETLERLRSCLNEYSGSHNFHNYTVGCEFKENSAKRYILSFKAFEPFVINDMEWVCLQVNGQSFMLHQIRKMVSMAILLVRYGTPPSFIKSTVKSTKINIPKAPALGLFLRYPYFTAYNRKFGSKSNDGNREDIDFTRKEAIIKPFIEDWIYSKIYEEEEADFVYVSPF